MDIKKYYILAVLFVALVLGASYQVIAKAVKTDGCCSAATHICCCAKACSSSKDCCCANKTCSDKCADNKAVKCNDAAKDCCAK